MSGWAWIRGWRCSGYDALRVALGLLLSTTAVLKARYLEYYPIASIGLVSRESLMIVAELELILGAWLLVGVFPHTLRWMTFAVFATFGGYSLYLITSGSKVCPCFGEFSVSPRITAMIDLVACAFLLAARPAVHPPHFDSEVPRPRAMAIVCNHAKLCIATLAFGFAIWLFVRPFVEQATAKVRGEPLLVQHPERIVVADPDKPVVVGFTIRNIRSSSVTIVGAHTSCGCATVNRLPLTISPGDTCTVEFSLAAGTPTEEITQEARLFVNVESSPIMLRVVVRPPRSS